MPHLTSGLLCLKRPEPEIVRELAEWIHEHCAPCAVYLVQLDEARSAALAVEALTDENGHDGEVELLSEPSQLRFFARHFRRPFWGGFAIGGYTNEQEAIAVDAKGAVRWRSRWNFEYSARLRERSLYALGTDDDFDALSRQERAKKGYGRIGAELKADFYELLSIERGDPLTNVPFLELKPGVTAKSVERFLGRDRPRSRLPAEPAAEQVYVALDGERPSPQNDVTLLAMLVALACKQRKLKPPRFAAFGSAARLVIGLEGPAVATLAKIVHRDSFLSMLNERLGVPVQAMSVRKGRVIGSNGRLNETTELRGGAPLVLPADIRWAPFPAIPTEGLAPLAAGLRRYAAKRSREEAAPQVIVRSGAALLG